MKNWKIISTTTALALSSSVNATIINTWNDEASFIAANAPLSMESFERTSSSDLPLVAGDITVSTDNTTYGSFNGTTSDFGVTDGVQAVRYGADDGDSIFFDFSSAINLFGINIWGFGTTSGAPVFTLYDGLGNSEVVLSGTMSQDFEFFGFESDLDVVQVQFTLTGASGDGIYFDEAYYAASAVPVPAAVWLFGSGLLGLIGVARNTKNHTLVS